MKKDEEWDELKEYVHIRDVQCRLHARIQKDDPNLANVLKNKASFLFKQYDVAHVFSRGSAPSLKYDSDNVVLLNRYSHSNLDQMRHPITGAQLPKEYIEEWWKYIVGEDTYTRLKSKLEDK